MPSTRTVAPLPVWFCQGAPGNCPIASSSKSSQKRAFSGQPWMAAGPPAAPAAPWGAGMLVEPALPGAGGADAGAPAEPAPLLVAIPLAPACESPLGTAPCSGVVPAVGPGLAAAVPPCPPPPAAGAGTADMLPSGPSQSGTLAFAASLLGSLEQAQASSSNEAGTLRSSRGMIASSSSLACGGPRCAGSV